MSTDLVEAGRYDYGGLEAEARIVVQQRTGEIKSLMRRTAQDIVEVGQKLIEVKEKLPHGEFGTWLGAEFEWTERTARRFMSVATAFNSDTVSVLNADARALYLLASPSTPEEARAEALAAGEGGERLTYGRAQQIVDQYRPAPEVPDEAEEAEAEIDAEYVVDPPPAPVMPPPRPAPQPAPAGQARGPAPTRPAPPPPPPPRPAPVMRPVEAPAPAARNVVVTATIFPGEDLPRRRVMVAISEQGAMIEQMRGGTYPEMLAIIRDLCQAKLAGNGHDDNEILMEV